MAVTKITFKNTPKYPELSFTSNQDNVLGPGLNSTGTNVFTYRYEGFNEYLPSINENTITPVHTLNIDGPNYNISALYAQINIVWNGQGSEQKYARTCYIHGVRRGSEITSNAEFIDMGQLLWNFSGQGLLGASNSTITIGLRLAQSRVSIQGFYRIYESNYD